MKVDFAAAGYGKELEAPPVIKLKSVYHLHADESYRVAHKPLGGTTVLLLTQSGRGELRVGGRALSLEKGTVLTLSPETDFQYWCGEKIWEFWWFEYAGDGDFPLPQTLTPYPFMPDELFLKLCVECLRFLQYGEALAASCAFMALAAFVKTGAGENARKRNEGLGEILTAIHSVQGNITVSGLAKQFYLSERALRNLFHREMGISPKEYIMKYRLETARYLLESTTMTLSQVADSLGYSSAFHFSSCFKESVGIAPSCYRRGPENR